MGMRMRMVKQGTALLLVLILALATGCGSKDKGLKLEGFSSSETAAVQEVLDGYGIEVETCERVIVDDEGDELLAALTAFIHPYDITAADGSSYRLTVNGNTNTLMVIVNSETGDIIHSMADGLMDGLDGEMNDLDWETDDLDEETEVLAQ